MLTVGEMFHHLYADTTIIDINLTIIIKTNRIYMTGPVKTVSDKKHKVLRKDKSVSSKLLQYFYNFQI